MNYFNSNLKILRKQKGYTQETLAKKLGIKRAVIGSYEEGRAEPRLNTLQNIAYLFGITIEGLINLDMDKLPAENSKGGIKQDSGEDIKGRGLRILPITVDEDNTEYINIVPIPASAGYLNGHADPEYIEELPKLKMPMVNSEKTCRLFQIKGDSMLPIQSGSYILAEYVQDWNDIKDDKPYILLTKNDGIVYKRVVNRIAEDRRLILKSDNPEYEVYDINVRQVLEVWRAIGYMSFDLPEKENMTNYQLASVVTQLQSDMEKLKEKLDL